MEKKQEGFATYLCVQAPDNGYLFEQRMIEHNKQLMLLSLQKREGEYYLEIQDKKEFLLLFKERNNDYDFVRMVILGVVTCLEQLNDYLLKADSVILMPETIFLDADGEVYLCYVPGYEGNIQQEFCVFMEYLMKYINHKEDNLVVLVYGIYHIVRDQQYSLLAVRQFMEERERGTHAKREEDELFLAASVNTSPMDRKEANEKNEEAEANSGKIRQLESAITGRHREEQKNQTEKTRDTPIHYQQRKELFRVKKQCIVLAMIAMLLLFAGISSYEAMFIYHTKAQGVSLWLVAAGCLLSFVIAFYKGSRVYKIKRNLNKNIVADAVDNEYNRG